MEMMGSRAAVGLTGVARMVAAGETMVGRENTAVPAAIPATARECPRVQGDLRSVKSAIASSAASNSGP